MRDLVRQLRLCSEAVSKFALGVCRSLRDDRSIELNYLTPYSVRRAGQGFVSAIASAKPLVGGAR
ncbi:MAG: hypothetical protein GXP62_10785 [Oligoflexia bacterium]|nr:hypothetical protein [Oligoflexia bacterium]